jgi:MATE family multidrug resistance protein
MFSFAFFTFQGAKQGEITLAANALLLNFITFMAYVLDGFANAVEVITGKAIGLKDEWMLKQGLKLSCMWALSIASLFSMTYWFYGQHIISLLSSIPEVITQAEHYLDWLVLMPVIGVWAYVFDGLFIGATQSAAMRNTMMFATIVCYLPAWYLLQPYGNDGLWAALMIFLLARAVGQLLYLPQIIKIKIPTKSLS